MVVANSAFAAVLLLSFLPVRVSSIYTIPYKGSTVPWDEMDFNNETKVLRCRPGVRLNCAMPYNSTGMTLVRFYSASAFRFRLGIPDGRTEFPFIWARESKASCPFDDDWWGVYPGSHDDINAFRGNRTSSCRQSTFHEEVWEIAKPVNLTDFVDTVEDAQWDYWEAREVAVRCAGYNIVRELGTTINFELVGMTYGTVCDGNVLLFPSTGKYNYSFYPIQPDNQSYNRIRPTSDTRPPANTTRRSTSTASTTTVSTTTSEPTTSTTTETTSTAQTTSGAAGTRGSVSGLPWARGLWIRAVEMAGLSHPTSAAGQLLFLLPPLSLALL